MDAIEAAIREVLKGRANLSVPADPLGVDDDLFDRGLTSLSTVEVMLALEERLDVEFPDAALSRQTFRSIAALRDALGGMGAVAA